MRISTGNPSSAHAGGASARRSLETAREQVAGLLGAAEPETVYFVSGGTEANNTVVASFARRDAPPTFLLAAVEHPSIIEPTLALAPNRVCWLSVDENGRIDVESARRCARQAAGDVVVLVQSVNSETGVIQPVGDVVGAVRSVREDAFIHLDAAQGVGRIHLEVAKSFDSIGFSGHKIHGPHGSGVLVLADRSRLDPLLMGGGQESGVRSGTQNVAGAVGLGVAARLRSQSFDEANQHMRTLRDRFERSIADALGDRVKINGATSPRVSNTTNLRFEGVDGMQLLAQLDAAGVMASQGSACASGRPEPSRVLRAMGLSEDEAYSSLRFSFSVLNGPGDATEAAEIVVATARRLMR